MQFRVKICGITQAADAWEAVAAGADALGLNFYSKSPRYVGEARASEVVAGLPSNVVKAGVFVNASAPEIGRYVERVPLDAIQLHGTEPPELVADLPKVPVIRAVRCHAGQVAEVLAWVEACQARATQLAALLIDAVHAGEFGGTGKLADWKLIPAMRGAGIKLPIILAGGLKPDNVAEAIHAARPDAVDTASGVERAPGIKDNEKVRQFVRAARQAFGTLEFP